MKKLLAKVLPFIVHGGAWITLAWWIFAFNTGRLTVNPIQAFTQRTGDAALIFLLLSLSITPLHTLTGWNPIVKQRRSLGLYAFMFAAIHLLTFIGLDYGFDFRLLWNEVFSQKRYALVGSLAFIILLALAATSFKRSMKRLGKKWKQLHRLVYLAGILVVIHFAWVIKGNVVGLSGDVIRPVLAGGVLLLLLVLRLPPVRRRIAARRKRNVRKINPGMAVQKNI